MSNLKDLSVTQATHAELVEATDFYNDTLETRFPESTFIMAIIAFTKPPLEKLKQALLALRSNALVKELGELDLLRDNAFIMFRDYISLYARSAVEAKKAAYDRIWPLIKKAGVGLWSLGDAEETGKLQSLFLELDKTERQADLQELNAITEFYAPLKTAEANFEALTANKLDDVAKENIPTIKASRTELEPLIRDLFPALRWLARTTEAANDLRWIDTMNEKTDLVMTQVAARRSRKDNEEE